jgi:PadR family transcriptional regulator, regulatory protein PadR
MDSAFFNNWTTQLRKGTLELCVLCALCGQRQYGYDIIKRLRGIDGLMIGEGTVYPILSRFHREGLVTTSLEESSEGPARKYYELTARGRRELTRMATYWRFVRNGIDTLSREALS